MPPCVTVLQLDTAFPRVAGDVSSPETYEGDVQILRIPQATVGQVVSADPAAIPIAPFERALPAARGALVVTSCGFLAYWQEHLAARTPKPFISSALTALPRLCAAHAAEDILTVTFDAERLNARHFGGHQTDVLGLHPDMHLRRVITDDLPELDTARAGRELVDCVIAYRKPHHVHILLECTNLPPYKSALAAATGLPISDILTCIEAVRPGTVRPAFHTQK